MQSTCAGTTPKHRPYSVTAFENKPVLNAVLPSVFSERAMDVSSTGALVGSGSSGSDLAAGGAGAATGLAGTAVVGGTA